MQQQSVLFILHCSFCAELEDLIRRVLVKNPSQRYTIEQIKQHAWMQADRGYAFQAEINKDVNIDLSMETGIDGDLNAQVLTLMQSLGIEAERTKKVRALNSLSGQVHPLCLEDELQGVLTNNNNNKNISFHLRCAHAYTKRSRFDADALRGSD